MKISDHVRTLAPLYDPLGLRDVLRVVVPLLYKDCATQELRTVVRHEPEYKRYGAYVFGPEGYNTLFCGHADTRDEAWAKMIMQMVKALVDREDALTEQRAVLQVREASLAAAHVALGLSEPEEPHMSITDLAQACLVVKDLPLCQEGLPFTGLSLAPTPEGWIVKLLDHAGYTRVLGHGAKPAQALTAFFAKLQAKAQNDLTDAEETLREVQRTEQLAVRRVSEAAQAVDVLVRFVPCKGPEGPASSASEASSG